MAGRRGAKKRCFCQRNTDAGFLVQRGLHQLPIDYGTGIRNFLAEYLGVGEEKVPFGGREDDLAKLDEIPGAGEHSRLACQIEMISALDGLEITIETDSLLIHATRATR